MGEEADVLRAINATLQNVTVKPSVGISVTDLPSPPSTGMTAVVNDGDSGLAWGAQVTNAGSADTVYFVFYNGTQWSVGMK